MAAQRTSQRKENKTEAPNELEAPFWAVVSFDGLEAGGLTYSAARKKMNELDSKRIAGLCIITDPAAGRLKQKSKA